MIGGGLGLLVPPLTSTLLGSVEKSRSGIAAGVLNATRQTGSVLGVALFGSLVGQSGGLMSGLHAIACHIGIACFSRPAPSIWLGASRQAGVVTDAENAANIRGITERLRAFLSPPKAFIHHWRNQATVINLISTSAMRLLQADTRVWGLQCTKS